MASTWAPEEMLALFGRERASAILRTDVEAHAGPAMEAAVQAGFRVLEFTLTTPGALDRIAEFASREGLCVGAGTVLTPADARHAVERGASFLVSPVVDEAVIHAALELGVPMMAGTHTPTEMKRSHDLGARLQKLFPAPGLGPAYVSACLGPLPFLKIVPTNGVSEENAVAWLEAGAFALGFVAPLFDKEAVRAGRFAEVEARGKRLLAAIR